MLAPESCSDSERSVRLFLKPRKFSGRSRFRLLPVAAVLLLPGCNSSSYTTPPTITVSISPRRGALATTQTLTVTATVNNDPTNAGVNWTSTGGTISASGNPSPYTYAATFTAPGTAGSVTITATSVKDATKSASATIGVTDLAGVFTYHNNAKRDGANTQEYALTTANVASGTFAKLFSCAVDGAIYAQPLWVAQLNIGGAKHNVVIVATMHESVYAFDADANPCSTLWHVSLIDNAHGGTAGETSVPSGVAGAPIGNGYGDIQPEIGITSTPVIDPATNTVYVLSKSWVSSGPTFFQRLHALDLTSGNEKFTGPHLITGSVAGTAPDAVAGLVNFDPQNQAQRPGLALSNGVVYVCWASHEDHDQYHGWIMGFSASTLLPVAGAILNTTPNTVGGAGYARGGIWMGGGAPAIDSSGNLYLVTGNGTFDGVANFGDSILKVDTSAGLAISDWFTPSDQSTLDGSDLDLGSGAAMVLIDRTTAPLHLMIGGGKHGSGSDGQLFVLDRDNMGGFTATDAGIVQKFALNQFSYATPAFWNNSLYIAGATEGSATGGPLLQFGFSQSAALPFNPVATSSSAGNYGFPGATPSI